MKRAMLFLLIWFIFYYIVGAEIRGAFVDERAEINLVEK